MPQIFKVGPYTIFFWANEATRWSRSTFMYRKL